MSFAELINIVLNDLSNDRIQMESELERLINSDINTQKKVKQIKVILDKIVRNDLMVGKWQSYYQPDNNEIKND